MKLLTKEIRATLLPLGAQENAADPVAHVKFFTPDAGWTWYATEGSPEGDDFMFFGYVEGGMTQLMLSVTQLQPYFEGSKRTLVSVVRNFRRQSQKDSPGAARHKAMEGAR